MKNIPSSPAQQDGSILNRIQAGRREGVSFEDVKKAAEKLTQEKLPVSLRTVRAELGTGSLSTVQKHLSALRSMEAPIQAEGPSPLSPQVLRALATEFDKATAERTASIEAELQDARGSIELLVQENEGLRVSAVETADVLERLRDSHAESAGTLDALRTQLAALNAQLSATQSSAETVKQNLAIAQEQRHASERHADQLEVELRAGRQEQLDLRKELQESRQDAEAVRRTVATLEAHLASKQQLEDHLKASTASAQQNLQRLDEAKLRLAILEAERVTQAERMTELRASLVRAEENAQHLLEKFLSGATRNGGASSAKK